MSVTKRPNPETGACMNGVYVGANVHSCQRVEMGVLE